MATTTLYNTLNTEVATLNSSINTTNTNVSNLTTRVGTAESGISTLNTKVGNIGVLKTATASKSVNPNNKTISIGCSVVLEPGTWVIYGQATCPGALAASRQGITLTTTDTAGTSNARAYDLKYYGTATGANLYYNVSLVQKINAQSTYYIMVFSGNHTINVTGYIAAVRIA